MRIKNFKKYLEKRLNKEEIKEIEQQAELEFKAIQSLRQVGALRKNTLSSGRPRGVAHTNL
jgi:RIO-like serine/threonine protein kinase